MDEEQEQHVAPGFTGQNSSADPGNQSPSDHDELIHMTDKTETQTADSAECSGCETREDPPCFTHKSEVTLDQNLQMVLKDLKGCVSEECFQHAVNIAKKSNEKIPVDPNELCMFFNHLVKIISHQRTPQTSEKGWGISLPSAASWFQHTVKVFPVVTGQTFGAENSILEQVKNVKWPTKKQQECDIITVFCPVTSRVGSDVEAAMRNTAVSSGEKPVILVVMHHTRDVAYSTNGRKWAEKYPQIKLEVHVLFHETQPGLLTCPKNDQAVCEIQKMLSNHTKWR